MKDRKFKLNCRPQNNEVALTRTTSPLTFCLSQRRWLDGCGIGELGFEMRGGFEE